MSRGFPLNFEFELSFRRYTPTSLKEHTRESTPTTKTKTSHVLVEEMWKKDPTQRDCCDRWCRRKRPPTPDSARALRPNCTGHNLLMMKGRMARIPSHLGRLEEKVHDNVKARQSHNVADQGREITFCTALPLHNMTFYEYLGAREG